MSIPVDKTINEIKEQLSLLGIDIPDDVKVKKDDLVNLVRDYFVDIKYGDNIPKEIELMREIKSPMLAMLIDKLPEDKQKEIIESKDWILEEKIDGLRCLILNVDNKVHIFIRKNDYITLLPIEITDIILDNNTYVSNDFIIDGEMIADNISLGNIIRDYGIMSNTLGGVLSEIMLLDKDKAREIIKKEKLEFKLKCLDIIYDNNFITNEPLKNRKEILDNKLKTLDNYPITLDTVNTSGENKLGFIDFYISNGYEGVIAKNLNSVYVTDTTRNRKGWIKIKNSRYGNDLSMINSDNYINLLDDFMDNMSNLDIFSDTYDLAITGYETSKTKNYGELVSELEVSLPYEDKNGNLAYKKYGKIVGMNINDMLELTEKRNSGLSILKNGYLLSMVEVKHIDGDIERGNGLFKFISLRPDKNLIQG